MAQELQDSWIRDVFGVDPARYLGGGVGGLAGAATTAVAGAKTAQASVMDGARDVADAIQAGVKVVGDGILDAEVARYEAAMKALDAEIKHVADAGLDTSHYAAQAKTIRDGYAQASKTAGDGARIIALGLLVVQADAAAAAAKTDVGRLAKSAVEGVGAAVTDMRDGAKTLIDELAKDNKEKPELTKRLGDLDTDIAAQGKVTDRAERAKALKRINVAAESLFDDAAAATKDADAVQAVYAKALKDRYGFDISNPSGMKNTHLDQVYKMFDKVPETDVVQGKLKTLSYQPLTKDKDGHDVKNTGAAYGGAEIEMGDYGDEAWNYLNPATGKADVDPKTGKPVEPNGFSISTLHELGHSVDDRFGIMSANRGKSGGGGWRVESVDSVGKALIAQFRSGPGKTVKVDDKALADAVADALSGAGASRPAGVSNIDWVHIIGLLDTCVACRHDKWPWGSARDVGGRSYHEAYPDEWWSYETAVRAKALTVRDYQWRAPGEWFAELYAYSYYNSKPPPGGVDAAITAYMFGGKSAASGAPAAAH